jgi:hypothetical protein
MHVVLTWSTPTTVNTLNRYQTTIDEIGNFNWSKLSREELRAACCAYYYFSVQFVECVHIACNLYPTDANLIALREGECDTDNLSPCPGIAKSGERMNHDEFMRRVFVMATLDQSRSEWSNSADRTLQRFTYMILWRER